MLELRALSFRRAGRVVLDGIDLRIGAGEFVGLLGPNGVGKTTLLRAALGLIPVQGHSSLAALPVHERARAAAYMPQGRQIAWPMPVEALVALGRIAHPRAAGLDDRAAIERAIAALHLEPLRHRRATELSGGEQARTLIARALAQETPLLIADEPIAGLDPAAQIEVMRLFRHLADQGRGVLASLHDLGLAARHCTRLILLGQGRIAADGPPETVLTAENLARIFGITAHLTHGPEGLLFQPLDTIPRD
ncbi:MULTISPECIES: ABC transporter ATP-binding protein [unclassified Paracoccus (in: a-proteobacteria)]|uniref:ABC transporter ATP-binding protein n=1 Tax=unclassified Paracoccus (in: a-proteobacteria) TaxID=2688777 RepID=UPI000225FC7F|nr:MULTISPECIES: ABC transporter ATP-binding protein [unclassified Paracoccus (in: a-proteobacteria)]SMG45927.1 iron complex transport system ATP-binding protein [Paracoccus sp. J56]